MRDERPRSGVVLSLHPSSPWGIGVKLWPAGQNLASSVIIFAHKAMPSPLLELASPPSYSAYILHIPEFSAVYFARSVYTGHLLKDIIIMTLLVYYYFILNVLRNKEATIEMLIRGLHIERV